MLNIRRDLSAQQKTPHTIRFLEDIAPQEPKPTKKYPELSPWFFKPDPTTAQEEISVRPPTTVFQSPRPTSPLPQLTRESFDIMQRLPLMQSQRRGLPSPLQRGKEDDFFGNEFLPRFSTRFGMTRLPPLKTSRQSFVTFPVVLESSHHEDETGAEDCSRDHSPIHPSHDRTTAA